MPSPSSFIHITDIEIGTLGVLFNPNCCRLEVYWTAIYLYIPKSGKGKREMQKKMMSVGFIMSND